ncbi:MAG: sn-glycerol-3-phosphate-binding periplasmic protein UgpB precursor [Planctomycetes bacterium ADurb.Bin401]|nr:MAG: sn-glycerol-3-phosphate-binding periplasmic protein UgpB precursor [Planctomycetes bacterium ADurb.Bin401]
MKHIFCTFLLIICGVSGCDKSLDLPHKDRIVINYWEMWTGFELQAAKDLVDKFNNSQDEIFVNLLSVSELERKLLIAIAGNDPPDLANLQDSAIPKFGDKNAIEQIDDFLPLLGVSRQDYIDIFWELSSYENKLYGLPIASTTIALHYNQELFSSAGFQTPPLTLEQLDEYAKKLTIKTDGGFETLGFVPTQPGWWNYGWVWWFGGDWFDGKNITANRPENVQAFQWVQSYAKIYGARSLQNFTSGFGAFSWSDDRFMTGKLAMVLQGTWMSRFISEMAPQLNWSAEAFPSSGGKLKDVTLAECNVLVIPRGAKHKSQALEFMRFIQQPENLRHIALNQNKFVPLTNIDEDFYSSHPNKEIKLFTRLSKSPNAHCVPRLPIWQEYVHEIDNAFQSVWLEKKTPQQALDDVQKRIEIKWKDYLDIKKKLPKLR